MATFRKKGLGSRVVFICLLAFIIRTALAIFLYYQNVAKGGDGNFTGYDDSLYWQVGQRISDYWNLNGLFAQGLDVGFSLHIYYYINGFSNWAFGANGVLALLFLNVIFGTLVVYLTFLIGRDLDGSRAGEIAAVFVALLPRFVFWSSLNYRDVFLALALLLVVYAVGNAQLNLWLSLFWLILGVGGMLLFRPWQGVVIIFAIFILSFYVKNRRILGFLSQKKIVFPSAVICSILLFRFALGAGFEGFLGYFQSLSDTAWGASQDVSSPNSLFAPYFTMGAFGRILLIPLSIPISLLYPFPPWLFLGNPVRDVETLSNWLWYPTVPLVIYSLVHILRDRTHGGFVAAWLTLAIFMSFQPFGPILLPRAAYGVHALFMVFAAYGIRHVPMAAKGAFGMVYVVLAMAVGYILVKGEADPAIVLAGLAGSFIAILFLLAHRPVKVASKGSGLANYE